MLQDAPRHLDRHHWSGGDLFGYLQSSVVKCLVSHDTRHDAVSVSLLSRHHSTCENQVAGDSCSANLIQPSHATGIRNYAVSNFGKHESGALSSDPHIAEKCTLK